MIIKKRVIDTAVKTAMLFSLFLIAAGSLSAQTSGTTKAAATNGAATTNPQTVNAQQSGPWTVGIDQARNKVQLSNTEADPLPVRTVSARKPFQARAVIGLIDEAFSSLNLTVPAGKRLVIENITASARTPPGLRAEIHVITYFDNDGNGVGDLQDMMFNRVVLVDQGTFQGFGVASANHKVLAFADSMIGTTVFPVVVQGRINGATTGFAQAHVTISGYLEDLSTTP